MDAVADNGLDIYAYYMMVNARATPAVQKAAWKLARFYTDHAAELLVGAGLFVPRSEVHWRARPTRTIPPRRSSGRVEEVEVLAACRRLQPGARRDPRGRDKLVQGEKIDDVLPVMNDEVNAVMSRERARAATLVK